MTETNLLPTALIILHPGFEEMEAITPIDLLRRAGVAVSIASVSDRLTVIGKSNIHVHAEVLLENVSERTFDLIVLPGGPGVQAMKSDLRIHAMLRQQHEARRWIGAICAAPLALHEAGILEGYSYTAHQSTADTLTEIDDSVEVVVDEPIITSRGAGTATEFALQLVETLTGIEKRDQIAKSIHWE